MNITWPDVILILFLIMLLVILIGLYRWIARKEQQCSTCAHYEENWNDLAGDGYCDRKSRGCKVNPDDTCPGWEERGRVRK
jgi:hypothetical protein